MTQIVKTVVIVGGGTAGWITAGTIAAMHKGDNDNCIQVVLVESPDIKPIGVGEGTWPSMRITLRRMGVSEADLIRECAVSYKQGTKFVDWVNGEPGDFYYHPFTAPKVFRKVILRRTGCTKIMQSHFHKRFAIKNTYANSASRPRSSPHLNSLR